MALFGCKKCGRSFEELKLWDRLEFCGDHWKCTSCDEDITKDLNVWFKECMETAKLIGGDLSELNEDL
jgi:NAD-dependent SIR2 family protein deacetylase